MAAVFIITKLWKQPKCPSVGEWTKKLWYSPGWVAQLVEASSHTLKCCALIPGHGLYLRCVFDPQSGHLQGPTDDFLSHQCFSLHLSLKSTNISSTDEFKKTFRKLWYIYTTGYYLAIKKDQNLTICNSMDVLLNRGPSREWVWPRTSQ